MISSTSVLRIGDYVALRHSKPNDGWLCSEGILDDEVFVSKNRDDFDDCLWEVYVQNQYSALNEYEEATSSGYFDDLEEETEEKVVPKIQTGSEIPKVAQKSLAQKKRDILLNLRRAAINEQRLNEKLMALKIGMYSSNSSSVHCLTYLHKQVNQLHIIPTVASGRMGLNNSRNSVTSTMTAVDSTTLYSCELLSTDERELIPWVRSRSKVT